MNIMKLRLNVQMSEKLTGVEGIQDRLQFMKKRNSILKLVGQRFQTFIDAVGDLSVKTAQKSCIEFFATSSIYITSFYSISP